MKKAMIFYDLERIGEGRIDPTHVEMQTALFGDVSVKTMEIIRQMPSED